MPIKLFLPFIITPVQEGNFSIYTFTGLNLLHTFIANDDKCENFKLGIAEFEEKLKDVVFKTEDFERFSKQSKKAGYYHEIEISGLNIDPKATATMSVRIPYLHMLKVRDLVVAKEFKNNNAFIAEAIKEKLEKLGCGV